MATGAATTSSGARYATSHVGRVDAVSGAPPSSFDACFSHARVSIIVALQIWLRIESVSVAALHIQAWPVPQQPLAEGSTARV